jgi:hypothetical protein
MEVRLSSLRVDRPPFTIPGIFLVLISVRGWVDHRAVVRLEGLGKLKKKSNGLIGNRTRDIPACSIVPQPTTLPRAPKFTFSWLINIISICFCPYQITCSIFRGFIDYVMLVCILLTRRKETGKMDLGNLVMGVRSWWKLGPGVGGPLNRWGLWLRGYGNEKLMEIGAWGRRATQPLESMATWLFRCLIKLLHSVEYNR